MRQGAAGLVLRFARPGTAVVRVRASALWTTGRPGTCVGATRDGWLAVHDSRAGVLDLQTALSADVLTGADSCS